MEYERDAMGNVLRETSTAHAEDDDVMITHSRYDDAGNMVAQAIDIGGNGRKDTCTHYDYACWR